MTLEEAKKILKKEGFILSLASKVINQTGAIREFEKPEVCEAIKVANANKWIIGLSPIEWNEREKRLKKEHEKNNKESAHDKLDILEIASSSKQTIAEQADKIKRLGKEITRLNKAIHKKNMKIEEFRKESSRHLRGKIKMFGENLDLEQELKDKVVALAGVAEGLRLSKIREKNLTEVCQKYIKENEKLKKKLADKIVDEIDARALKSAESALAYKEKVIAEKDEVIADLGKELAEAKKLNTAKILDINAKCMRAARESINDVFESYAAKYAKSTLDELKDKAYESFNAKAHKLGLVGSKDGKGLLNQMAGVDAAEEGADQSGKIVICGKDFGKLLKENEESAEELSKVLNDVIDQFLLFGEIIIKSEK